MHVSSRHKYEVSPARKLRKIYIHLRYTRVSTKSRIIRGKPCASRVECLGHLQTRQRRQNFITGLLILRTKPPAELHISKREVFKRFASDSVQRDERRSMIVRSVRRWDLAEGSTSISHDHWPMGASTLLKSRRNPSSHTSEYTYLPTACDGGNLAESNTSISHDDGSNRPCTSLKSG